MILFDLVTLNYLLKILSIEWRRMSVAVKTPVESAGKETEGDSKMSYHNPILGQKCRWQRRQLCVFWGRGKIHFVILELILKPHLSERSLTSWLTSGKRKGGKKTQNFESPFLLFCLLRLFRDVPKQSGTA